MDQKQNEAYLITGTNLGNKQANLDQAIVAIKEKTGSIAALSSVYETEPWGITDQPGFYNQVLKVHTGLTPVELLNSILQIEKEMGRIRLEKYGARIIDIDILFFNQLIIHSEKLALPHPRIVERNFVLAPLAEIAPDFIHPVLKKKISQLWEDSHDPLSVKKLSNHQ